MGFYNDKMPKNLIFGILAIFLFVISLSSINAAETNITSNDNLGKIIENATEGSIINLDKGTYKNNVTNIKIDKNLTIVGKGSKNTIIDAQRLGRIFSITGGNKLILRNITLTNGYFNGGGAISNNGLLNIAGCELINNDGQNTGGAIRNNGGTYSSKGSVIINHCNFTGNSAGNGGAIYNIDPEMIHIINSTFLDNHATVHGGAIRMDQGQLIATFCNFTHNQARYGSAIRSLSRITISMSNFKNNANDAILHEGYNLSVFNCNFTNNNRVFNITGNNSFIKSNNIINNKEGIYLNNTSTNTWISNNRIFNNTNYNLYVNNTTATADYNWWGSNTVKGVTGVTLKNYFVARANVIKNKDVIGGKWIINYTYHLNTDENYSGIEYLPDFRVNLIDSSNNVIFSQSAKNSSIISVGITKLVNENHYILVDNELISLGIFSSEKINTATSMNITGKKDINQSIVISGNLKDKSGHFLNNKTVNLIVNGKIIATGQTDVLGNIIFNYTILNRGNHVFELKFNEDNIYNSSSTSQKFNIEKIGSQIQISTIKETKIGKNVVLKALLTDSNGDPIVGKLVAFYVNGVKIDSILTSHGGIAILSYTPTKTGDFKVDVMFEEDSDYLSSKSYSYFKVSKNNPEPKPDPKPQPNQQINKPTNYSQAGMKSTGIPVAAIILILLTSLGFTVRKK